VRLAALTSLALIGCAEVENKFQETVPAGVVAQVYAAVDRGDVTYTGDADAVDITFDVRSWGRGGGKGKAASNEAANDWGVQVLDSELTAWGLSPKKTAGVDFGFAGPEIMDVEIVTLEGDAELYGVDGAHIVTADSVVGTAISGSADLYASRGGVTVELYPDFGSLIVLEAVDGDIVLGLPFGLQYDIEVLGDWDYPMDVEDLGFDAAIIEPGYFASQTGGGNVVVQVYVDGGGFYLYESPPL